MGPTDPPGTDGGSKAPLVLGIALVFVVVAVGAAVLLLMSGGGDDGGGDEEASTETTEVADEDASDEFDDFSDDFSDDVPDEPDADGDGLPDAEDPDDDDDGVPDAEDPDDDGDGVPDAEEDGGGEGDDGEPGDDEDPDHPDDDEDLPALDLLRNDPRPAVDAWIDAAGDGSKAVEVVLYPDYGFADVRDPEHPNRILEFGWRDGAVQGPEPAEPFPGTDLDAESFRMTAVNWDALPGLVAQAPDRAGLPRGEVTHVIVTSDLPFSDRFLFRVYVTAPNGSDYVVATIDGQPANR